MFASLPQTIFLFYFIYFFFKCQIEWDICDFYFAVDCFCYRFCSPCVVHWNWFVLSWLLFSTICSNYCKYIYFFFPISYTFLFSQLVSISMCVSLCGFARSFLFSYFVWSSLHWFQLHAQHTMHLISGETTKKYVTTMTSFFRSHHVLSIYTRHTTNTHTHTRHRHNHNTSHHHMRRELETTVWRFVFWIALSF